MKYVYFDVNPKCPRCGCGEVKTPMTQVSEQSFSYQTKNMTCVNCGKECDYLPGESIDGSLGVSWIYE